MAIFDHPPIWLQSLIGRLVVKMPADEKSLYLTFDDGPTTGHTQWILDTLKSYEAQATFFCIGKNIRKNPGLFDELLKAGHQVGNHSDQHIHNWKCSVEEIQADFEECQKLHPFTLYRPPYGELGRKSLKAIPDKKFILWDVLSEDYREDKSGDYCLEKVIKEAVPGSIVVLHDSDKASSRMRYVLPRILEHFKTRGFVFKSIPQS